MSSYDDLMKRLRKRESAMMSKIPLEERIAYRVKRYGEQFNTEGARTAARHIFVTRRREERTKQAAAYMHFAAVFGFVFTTGETDHGKEEAGTSAQGGDRNPCPSQAGSST